ncbi:hypothetical protein WICPIJ_009747 [Wickerhamomyces pijperi]|uniref:Uncharacterized protein n=1 Tax=Wickerhamomyces pijperi TaxID=599730 RepID=A0A9P8TCA6_WICPI|nr:hypothetical protein WICPIJ_009747 [Wickerhamomyces pijperi]
MIDQRDEIEPTQMFTKLIFMVLGDLILMYGLLRYTDWYHAVEVSDEIAQYQSNLELYTDTRCCVACDDSTVERLQMTDKLVNIIKRLWWIITHTFHVMVVE